MRDINRPYRPEDYIDRGWQQSLLMQIFDAIFTGLMWAIFIVLIAFNPTLFTLGDLGITTSLQQPTTAYGFIPTFGWYILVIAANAAILVLWAGYNCFRFRDKEKRKFEKHVTVDETAAFFGSDPVLVQNWQNTQRIVINYNNQQQVDYYG